jgi:small subunit ribosomal protein S17
MADEVENNEVEETTAPDAAAEAPAEAEAPVAAEAPAEEATAEPAVLLSPKERKQAAKAKKASPTRAAVSPEERQAERDKLRRQKAVARSSRRAQERAKYKASEHERQPTPAREHVVGLKKTRQGIVVSDKADKTITVRLDVARRHRKYQKIVRTSTTVHAHDESNDANIGDTVVVLEARPLSRTKRWRLVEVVARAK